MMILNGNIFLMHSKQPGNTSDAMSFDWQIKQFLCVDASINVKTLGHAHWCNTFS